ncbi:uncharacterized protein STEHIDRAFT_42438, partial [Stereum hirsutum FP-91666 SS1]
MNTQQYKAEALKHLLHGGTALGIGRSEEPESLWDNPTLYSQIFPWLFPYGKGGIGHALAKNKIEDHTRKGQLLLYHDKRFQIDPMFPLVALNHEQIKQCAQAGSLLTNKANFNSVADRLVNLDQPTL